ncbi:MAG: C4-dicarboxylate ABC transporter [Rhodospirillaceae bacterium]|nr:C4-dicarboxylate ABC transporter [Rhodospirillaceae bacterium]|tara:strand:- start:52 stop:1149 length:1098 start_codon:yes stop_codon:yes gene_type:complete
MRSVLLLLVGLVVGAAAVYFVVPRGGTETPAVAEGTEAPAAASDPEVRWKMGSTYPATLVQLGELGKRIESQIDKVSGGNFKIKFFEPSALVPALEVFDAVSEGSIDAGWSTPGYWAGKVPALQFFAAVPFGPRAPEYMAWVYYGGGKELYDELYARHNIKGLLCAVIPPEASGWFRKPINSPEDLKGLKMRFFGLGAKVMEKLGVSTQLLAGGDIYPALELGTIDATEFSMPAIDLNLGFYQIAKEYYFPGWHQQSTFFELIMNMDRWNALTDTQKAQIETVCGDQFRQSIAEGEYIQIDALQQLEDHGVNIHSWPPEMLDRFHAAWDEVVEEESAADPDFKRVWESLKAFRESYSRWRDLGYL